MQASGGVWKRLSAEGPRGWRLAGVLRQLREGEVIERGGDGDEVSETGLRVFGHGPFVSDEV